MVRNVVRHMMEAEGHEVFAAADGMEALEISRQYSGNIDLLITDISMPRVDGIALIRQILQERPNLRILVMTGKPSPEVALSDADFRLIRKPFLPAAFRQTVKNLLSDPPPSARKM